MSHFHFRRKLFIASLAVLGTLGFTSVNAQEKPPIKIGFSMGETGPMAGNGKAAKLSMEIWREDINAKGGLLGRKVEFISYDDQSNASLVPGIYTKLIDSDKVDLVVSSYGTNFIAPAMPTIMQRNLTFMTLFGMGVNQKFNYPRYFQIMPNGIDPTVGFTYGFFEAAMQIKPKPTTVALVGTDAEYPALALEGARINAKKMGLKIVYDKTYPPNTTDYAPVVRAIQATNADIVYVASYPSDTVGMIRAANEVGLKTKIFGGGMIGLGFASIKKQLGPLLNGVVGYELYVPEPTVKFPGIEAFLKKYQSRAEKEGVDPLGFYLPPYAYAMMEILGNSIEKVGSLDQGKLADYMHKNAFKTVVGDVEFAANGEWKVGRPMYVQYKGVAGNDIEQFRLPGKAPIMFPKELKSGELRYPYEEARKQ